MKNKIIKRLALVALPTLMLGACSKTPSGVLPPEEMAALLADVYRGEAALEYNYDLYYNDSTRMVAKQSIFAAHGVTQADFDSSLTWYGHNIDQYIKVCDRAIEMLEEVNKSIPDGDANSLHLGAIPGDSAQVWPLASTSYRITPQTATRFLPFTLRRDTTWHTADNYTLAFKLLNLRSRVSATIAVDYEDGGTEYMSNTFSDDGWQRTSIELDTARQAKAIYGFIQFTPSQGENIFVDSISLVRTRGDRALRFRYNNNTQFRYGKKAQND